MRIEPAEYRNVDLVAHTLLADVPLHDAWAVDLPSETRRPTIPELREIVSAERFASVNAVVRALFAARAGLGALFGWDREERAPSAESYLHRLPPELAAASLVAPGTADGPFRTLYQSERESIAEVINATVHAFLVLALAPRNGDTRLYWGVYVRPVGRITAAYMRLIDPFRHYLVYPAILRYIRRAWEAGSREG